MFQLDNLSLRLSRPFAFSAQPDSLDLAIDRQLLNLSPDFKTNWAALLPDETTAPVSCVCSTRDRTWIGTRGNGLFEYDKEQKKFRHWSEQNGLLLNSIRCLYLQDHTLWIGFGAENAGGVGRLDLGSGQVTALTPSLLSDTTQVRANGSAASAPRVPIYRILGGAPGDLWIEGAHFSVRRYRSAADSWDTPPALDDVWVLGFAADSNRLIIGGCRQMTQVEVTYPNSDAGGGPTTTNFYVRGEDVQEVQLRLATNAPRPSVLVKQGPCWPVLARKNRDGSDFDLMQLGNLPEGPRLLRLDGSRVWLGGSGYIALFDLDRKITRKVCYVPTRSIDDLQISGAYLWAQFNGHLYRAHLATLK